MAETKLPVTKLTNTGAPTGHTRLGFDSDKLRVRVSSGPSHNGHTVTLQVRTPEEIPGLFEGLCKVADLVVESHGDTSDNRG